MGAENEPQKRPYISVFNSFLLFAVLYVSYVYYFDALHRPVKAVQRSVPEGARLIKNKLFSLANYYRNSSGGFFLCPPGREWRWDESMVAVKSAYFHPTKREIVLICIGEGSHLKEVGRWPYEHYCQLHDENKKLIAVIPGYFPKGVGYMFFCNTTITITKVPSFIYMLRNDSVLELTPPWLAPVVNLEERKRLQENETQLEAELAIWMGPMMREQHWILLLQFFEYYQLHGVTKFFVQRRYPFMRFTQRLVDYYRQLGLVEIEPWDSHFLHCSEGAPWHCSSVPQKQDGIYKTAYMYKYLLMIDFDELVQPVDHQLKLIDFIRERDAKERKAGSFCFGAQYHMTDATQFQYETHPMTWENITEDGLRKFFPFIHWNNISDAFHPHSPKCIVKPETIRRMWVHNVAEFLPTGHYEININQEKEATIHHFKNVSTWPDVVLLKDSGPILRDPAQFFNSSFVDKMIKNMAFTLKKIYSGNM